MAKNWFKHDHLACRDSKLSLLRVRKGRQAIGLYWMLIEAMYDGDGYASVVDVEYLTQGETDECNTGTIEEMVNLGLIIREESGELTSRRVLESLDDMRKVSSARKQSAQKRWDANAMQIDANALQTDASAYKTSNLIYSDVDDSDTRSSISARAKDGKQFDEAKAAEAIAKRYPQDWTEAMPYFELYGGTEDDCKDWFDFRSGDGWKKGTNESRRYIADWHSDARAWARKRVKERAEGKLNKETKNATHKRTVGERRDLSTSELTEWARRIDEIKESSGVVLEVDKGVGRLPEGDRRTGAGGIDSPTTP